MNKRFKHTALTLFITASLGLSFNAQADIKVYVKNCAGQEVNVKSFNAKDNSMSVAYQAKKLIHDKGKSFKCKGQGKGRCKLEFTCNGEKQNERVRLKKNKWIKLTGCTNYADRNSATEPSCD